LNETQAKQKQAIKKQMEGYRQCIAGQEAKEDQLFSLLQNGTIDSATYKPKSAGRKF
jgi:hypothetical protein